MLKLIQLITHTRGLDLYTASLGPAQRNGIHLSIPVVYAESNSVNYSYTVPYVKPLPLRKLTLRLTYVLKGQGLQLYIVYL